MPYHLDEEDLMLYRLAKNLDLRSLCYQAWTPQEIFDARGHSIILAIGADGTVVTLAYALRASPAKVLATGESQDGNGRTSEADSD